MSLARVQFFSVSLERLWDGLEGPEKDYEIEATSSPSGVTHVTFTRGGA